MNFVIDSNIVDAAHPLLDDVYTFAAGCGRTGNARVAWSCVRVYGRKVFHCIVAHDSVNVVTYDGERVGDVWELVRG